MGLTINENGLQSHIENWHYARGTFDEVEALLPPTLETVVNVVHRNECVFSEPSDPNNEASPNTFVINIWAGAGAKHTKKSKRYTTNYAWDMRIPCLDDPMPSIEELPIDIIDDVGEYKEILSYPEGLPMGILYNRNTRKAPFNTLSIYWDIVHYGETEEIEILLRIVQEATRTGSVIDGDGHVIDMEDIIAGAVDRMLKEKQRAYMRNYDEANRAIESARENIVTMVRRKEEYATIIRGIEGDIEAKCEDVKNQIKELKNQYKGIHRPYNNTHRGIW